MYYFLKMGKKQYTLIHIKKKDDIFISSKIQLMAIRAKNSIPEHTKRGVVAQIHFCEE